MRARRIEEHAVLLQDALQVADAEHDHVIEALPTHRSEEAFAGRVDQRRVDRRPKDSDTDIDVDDEEGNGRNRTS